MMIIYDHKKLKRFFVAIAAICTISIGALQAQEMKKGMSLFNAGFGLVRGWGMNISYDYGLIDEWGPGIFTIGAYFGYGNWWESPNFVRFRESVIGFAPRATYRYQIIDLLEVFGTARMGVAFSSYSYHHKTHIKELFALSVGCRYSIDKNIAVFSEISGGFYNISFLNGGLSVSF